MHAYVSRLRGDTDRLAVHGPRFSRLHVAALAVLLCAFALALPASARAGWSPQTSGVAPTALRSVSFPDAQHGWAVGLDGTIVATTNGGTTWSPQASGTSEDLRSVSFPDASHGWAVGHWGTILATTNGGATWSAQSSGSIAPLWSVSFPDASNGWAVGHWGTILASPSGSKTWSPQTSGAPLYQLHSVCFPDAQHGWAVGNDGSGDNIILATTNGGTTWSPQSSGTTEVLRSVSFPDASHGWVVGDLGTVLATEDGGLTWSPQDSGSIDRLYSVSFPDAQHGWAVGSDGIISFGIILATEDGGLTWSPQDSGGSFALLSVCFPDAQHGWAVGLSGKILHYTPDTEAPVTTHENYDGLWTNGDVTLTFSATDAGGSGLDYTEYSFDGSSWTKGTSVTVTAEGITEVHYRSADNAGNLESAKTVEVKIDRAAPLIEVVRPVEGAQYALDQVVLASYSASDALSGVESLTATVADGTAIDTGSFGAKSFAVSATDAAGNTATLTVSYTVAYESAGLEEPVNADGSSDFKAGSTVPLKFSLIDESGEPVSGLAPKLYLAQLVGGVWGGESEPVSKNKPDLGNTFRETAAGTYMFNLSTKDLSAGTWRVRIALGDGGQLYGEFSLR